MIREEVDRLVRRTAGMVGGGTGISRGASELPPIGLGDDYERKHEEEQEQTTVGVDREGRQDSVRRTR